MNEQLPKEEFNKVEPILNQILHIRNVGGGRPGQWLVLRTFGGYIDLENAKLLRDWLNKALP